MILNVPIEVTRCTDTDGDYWIASLEGLVGATYAPDLNSLYHAAQGFILTMLDIPGGKEAVEKLESDEIVMPSGKLVVQVDTDATDTQDWK